jgi:hypothetical protein
MRLLVCCGCFDSIALHPAGCFSQPSNPSSQNQGVPSVPMIDSDWRTIEPVFNEKASRGLCAAWQTQDIANSACVEHSPHACIKLRSESQTIINAEYSQERLYWLEQAIASGRNETWLYYQVAEIASELGQTEKAERYLRIVVTHGWLPENSTLTHYGELSNG